MPKYFPGANTPQLQTGGGRPLPGMAGGDEVEVEWAGGCCLSNFEGGGMQCKMPIPMISITIRVFSRNSFFPNQL